MPDVPFVDFLAKASIPLGIATTIIGGSAWLTTMHNDVGHVQGEVSTLQVEFKEQKQILLKKVDDQETRLARIEGKLDFIIEAFKNRERKRE